MHCDRSTCSCERAYSLHRHITQTLHRLAHQKVLRDVAQVVHETEDAAGEEDLVLGGRLHDQEANQVVERLLSLLQLLQHTHVHAREEGELHVDAILRILRRHTLRERLHLRDVVRNGESRGLRRGLHRRCVHVLCVQLHRSEERDLRLVVVLPAGDETTEVLANVQRGEVATQVRVGATLLEVAAIGEDSA